MGAWGNGPFDNDDASDWLFELEDHGVSALRAALDIDGGHLEAPDAAAAVAAATVVGLAVDLPVETTEEIAEWLERTDVEEVQSLADSAATALARVLEASELADLYDENHGRAWREQVTALRNGLRG